ncbi:transmembrane protein 97 [Iris pallida]|uniref:Transmembrane protein 97 n=1 Tax=Iris pallida TaxID=29817 RepID=A0AAX6GVX1_IRIPA|nr:transmembrane protein 97 [Iris pallida]
MGLLSGVVDGFLLMYCAVNIGAIPLIDSQIILPGTVFPSALVGLKRWYVETFDDYLIAEGPNFYLGLVGVGGMCLILPLSVATVWGILARRAWVGSVILMLGSASMAMSATCMGELLGSGRASEIMLQQYVSTAAVAVMATLRGFFLVNGRPAASTQTSASKKRS